MTHVAIIYDPVFLEHQTGHHPESGKRLETIIPALRQAPFADKLEWKAPCPAPIDIIEKVHDPEYLRSLEEKCRSGVPCLDMDTVISPGSWESALMAVGAVIMGVDNVMSGEFKRVFAPVRPPGHHAERARGMGFCLLNNVAIGARYAVDSRKVSKAAIIDFDVHHGNGVQNAFYNDPAVFYVSLHQANHYPGTGGAGELGGMGAEGTNLNLPLLPGGGDKEYLEKFDQIIIPAVERFAPEIIFVSAGFDAHCDDHLSDMMVTSAGFGAITDRITRLAVNCGDIPLVSCLEGGYNLAGLGESVLAHVASLTAEPTGQ